MAMCKNVIRLCCLCVFFVLGIDMSSAEKPSDYSVLLDKCMREYQNGEYEKAIVTSKEILKQNRSSVVGRICLGSSLDEIGEKENAIKVLREAEQLAEEKDHLITIYNRLGSLFMDLGDMKNAINYNQMLLNIANASSNTKEQVIALMRIGDILSKTGEFENAIAYYTRAVEKATDAESKAVAYSNLASLYLKIDNPDKAVENYLLALDIEKTEGDNKAVGETLLNLGNAYRAKRDYNKAERMLLEGMEKVKGQKNPFWEATGHRYIAWLYIDQKMMDRALVHLKVAKDIFEAHRYMEYAKEVQKELEEMGHKGN